MRHLNLMLYEEAMVKAKGTAKGNPRFAYMAPTSIERILR